MGMEITPHLQSAYNDGWNDHMLGQPDARVDYRGSELDAYCQGWNESLATHGPGQAT